MYKDIRKKSVKKALPLVIAAVLLGLLLMACTGFSIFRMAAGPVPIEAVETDKLDGAYVEVELNTILDTFASSTVTSGSSTKTKAIYCIMSCGEEDKYYMIISLPGSYENLATAIAGEANSVYSGELDSMGDYGSVAGTVSESESSIADYYKNWFEDVSYFEDESQEYIDQHLLTLQVNAGKVGPFSEKFVLVFTVTGGVFILAGLVLLLLAALGVFSGGLKKYIGANAGGLSREEIESDYLSARELGKKVRAGKRFIWYDSGLGTKAISTEQTVWLYPRGKTLEEGKMRWTLVFCQRDKSERDIVTKDADIAQQIIDAVRDAGYPLITGYDQEKKQLYDRDFQQFLQLAKKNAK